MTPAITRHFLIPMPGPDSSPGRSTHRLGQPRPGRVAVDEQRAERGQEEEHQEDVEDAGAAERELQAVQGQQQPGGAAEQGGAGQPPGDPAHDQDGQRCRIRPGAKRQPRVVSP